MPVKYSGSSSNYLSLASSWTNNALYTVMCWARCNVLPSSGYYGIWRRTGNIDNAGEFLNRSGGLRVTSWEGSNETESANLVVGRWYHLTWVRFTTTNWQLFINGVYDHSAGGATDIFTSSTTYLGVWDATSDVSQATYADFRIWSGRALSVGEIQREMLSVAPIITANLWAWWPLYNGIPVRTLDFSGNNRTLTLTGSLLDDTPPPVPLLLASERYWLMPVFSSSAPSPLTATATLTDHNETLGGANAAVALSASASTLDTSEVITAAGLTLAPITATASLLDTAESATVSVTLPLVASFASADASETTSLAAQVSLSASVSRADSNETLGASSALNLSASIALSDAAETFVAAAAASLTTTSILTDAFEGVVVGGAIAVAASGDLLDANESLDAQGNTLTPPALASAVLLDQNEGETVSGLVTVAGLFDASDSNEASTDATSILQIASTSTTLDLAEGLSVSVLAMVGVSSTARDADETSNYAGLLYLSGSAAILDLTEAGHSIGAQADLSASSSLRDLTERVSVSGETTEQGSTLNARLRGNRPPATVSGYSTTSRLRPHRSRQVKG